MRTPSQLRGLLLAALLLPTLAGCSDASPPASTYQLHTFQEPHMGVLFTFRVYCEEDRVEELKATSARAFDRIAELNSTLSDYLPESEINDLARAPAGEPVKVSEDLFRVLEAARKLSDQTDGAFDVTAGPLIRLWRIAKKNRKLPTEDQLARAKMRTGYGLLVLDPIDRTVTKQSEGMLLDVGGIAKGYAADEALEIFRESGFPMALVAASGDIVAGDPPPGKEGWTIALELLQERTELTDLPTVILANQAVSTSGDTRRYFVLEGVRYSHIVSPTTGLGLTERIAASVIAPTAMLSDSHATAVTLLGRKAGLQFIENKREIECQIVSLDGDREVVTRSNGFPRFRLEIEEKAAVSAP